MVFMPLVPSDPVPEKMTGGTLPPLRRQRAEKNIDGVIDGAVNGVRQKKPPIFQRHIFLGRNEIDRIWLDLHAAFRLQHHHAGVLTQNFGHEALVVR